MNTKNEMDAATASHESWYVQAYDMTLDRLPEFLRMMLGTRPDREVGIFHALVAGALATMIAMAKAHGQKLSPQTSDRVMFMFITRWKGITGPIKLLRFDHMLFPTFGWHFKTAISPETWEYLQRMAQRRLLLPGTAPQDWRVHWAKITKGEIPFGWTLE